MRVGLMILLLALAPASRPACASENPIAPSFTLVRGNQPIAHVHAPGPNEWAGHRLAERLDRWAGVKLLVQREGEVPAGEHELIAIGTPQTNAVVREALAGDMRLAEL